MLKRPKWYQPINKVNNDKQITEVPKPRWWAHLWPSAWVKQDIAYFASLPENESIKRVVRREVRTCIWFAFLIGANVTIALVGRNGWTSIVNVVVAVLVAIVLRNNVKDMFKKLWGIIDLYVRQADILETIHGDILVNHYQYRGRKFVIEKQGIDARTFESLDFFGHVVNNTQPGKQAIKITLNALHKFANLVDKEKKSKISKKPNAGAAHEH